MVIGQKSLKELAPSIGYDSDNVQPSSVDLRLAGEILEVPSPAFDQAMIRAAFPRPNIEQFRQPVSASKLYDKLPEHWRRLGLLEHAYHFDVPEGEEFLFLPGFFYLATTVERLRIPQGIRGVAYLRSTPARNGVDHATALYLDPCFEGNVTLELIFMLPFPAQIGSRLIQVEFARVEGSGCYQGKYAGQVGLTPARKDERP